MRLVLILIAAVALIGFVAVAVVLPRMDQSKAKDAAQALVSGADPAKQQVGAAAEKSGNLQGAGKGIRLQPRNDAKYGEMKWIVSDNGAIRGWNEENALEVTLTPTLKGGKTDWTCKGYPVNAMPTSCGGRT